MGAPIVEAELLESRVERVTVHRSGAMVTRAATLPRGARLVKVGPLPLGIDDGTVRVEVEGTSSGTLEATELRIGLEVPAFDPELRPARPEDVREAEARLRGLERERARVLSALGRFEKLGVPPRPEGRPGRPPPASPAAARAALLSFRAERLSALDAERAALERAHREARRALEALRDRERRASSARRADPDELRKVVLVRLRGDGDGGRLRLTYLVDAARWVPSYVLRLAPDLSTGVLEVRASVCQSSGEDWRGVALSLSTATLRGWAELPELSSIRIGRQQPPRRRAGWRPPPTGADALFVDYDRAHASIVRPLAAPEPERPAPPPSPAQLPKMTMAGALPPNAFGPPLAAPMSYGGAPPMSAPPMGAAPAPMPSAPAAQGANITPADLMQEMDAGLAPQRKARSLAARLQLPQRSDVAASLAARPAPPPPPDAPRAMLDYASLVMSSYTAVADRGVLQLETRRVRYRRLVEASSIEVDVDRAFESAETRARRCLDAPLPPGCHALAPSGFDYLYAADGRLNVDSDGVFHALSLIEREVSAAAHFVVVPREKRDAFRFVRLDNPLDAPLLAGPVDVYVGEDFLLSSDVREVPPLGVLSLGLGVEQRIKVARNTLFEEETGGLMGGRLDLHHRVDVELDNQLPRPADVEIRDRLPVLASKKDDDIKILVDRMDPPSDSWEPEDDPSLEGGFRWRVRIAAGEKRRLTAQYTVRIAGKHELVGGNRRED